jgi:hypothetical protein
MVGIVEILSQNFGSNQGIARSAQLGQAAILDGLIADKGRDEQISTATGT